MIKTSLYIDAELDRALGREAAARGISKAELIRRSLAHAIGEGPPHPRIAAIGVGEGPGDVAGNIDRHLAETGFGGR
jgi:Ribbon-helix-helix protein, copG family